MIKFLLLFLLLSPALYAQTPIEEDDSNGSSSSNVATSGMTAEQRVDKLERQMRNQTNLLKQIDTVAQQVKDLQGQLEIATHEIKTLQDQQKSQYSDLDQRVSDLSHQKEERPHLAVDKKTDNAAESNAKAISSDSSAKEDKGQKAYQAAYALLKTKNYDKAKNALQSFIRTYPDDANIVNAYYWLGNIYLLKNQPDKAIVPFKMAIKTDAQHIKTADTLFKLGLAYLMQGNTKQARIQFKKVKQSYPRTIAAKLASEKLNSLKV